MGTSTLIKSRRKWTLLMTGKVRVMAECSCLCFISFLYFIGIKRQSDMLENVCCRLFSLSHVEVGTVMFQKYAWLP